MNIVRIRRLTVHMFFSTVLFVALATPVFAITAEMTTSQTQNIMPVTEPLALATPKPVEESSEAMGPHKPEGNEATPTPAPTKSPKTTPTEKPSPTSIATPAPTIELSPTAAPTTPTATSSNTSTGGLNADVLFAMSNNYRAGLGMSTFQTDPRICSLAQARAPEIAAEISGGYMHAGKNNHNFPYWFTENIITMRTEAEAFNWWINDHIHRVQIEENNTHSCVACAGNACVQHFTSFRPK